jgi:DNA-binding GntR family transcriptional regulator
MKKNGKSFSRDGAGNESGPLYRRLAHLVKQDIVSGVYQIGTLLPTEQELCDRFTASRYTVREALRLLEEDGMVERRQGRGTEVISNTERPVFAQSLTSLSQLYDYAAETRLRIERVMRIVPDATLAHDLGRMPGREWVLAEGMRTTTSGDIICVSRIFIHQDFAGISDQIKTHKGAIHRLIEDRFDVRVIEVCQEITSVKLEESMARILEQPSGADAILVTRRYLSQDDRPVLVSFNWHQLDGFRHNQVIRRE